MNRATTNLIRHVMDEYIPASIRDSRWFMFPFYWLAYRGKNISTTMNFKKLVHSFSDDEYRDFYAGLDSISRNRATDLNEATILAMLARLPTGPCRLLDVGCGRGYFLERVKEARPDIEVVGCDVVAKLEGDFSFEQGRVEALPFEDESFDVVTCSHTLEHVLSPRSAVSELKRVTRGPLIVVVPCQRYFFYTLDEHVNFYPHRHLLMAEMAEPGAECIKVQGDWLWFDGRLKPRRSERSVDVATDA